MAKAPAKAAAPRQVKFAKPEIRLTHKKRTSIGRYGVPLNKHKRRSWKLYRGQGCP